LFCHPGGRCWQHIYLTLEAPTGQMSPGTLECVSVWLWVGRRGKSPQPRGLCRWQGSESSPCCQGLWWACCLVLAWWCTESVAVLSIWYSGPGTGSTLRALWFLWASVASAPECCAAAQCQAAARWLGSSWCLEDSCMLLVRAQGRGRTTAGQVGCTSQHGASRLHHHQQRRPGRFTTHISQCALACIQDNV